jgi:hypothetical protein
MISARNNARFPRATVVKQILRLRRELDDLRDYLDLLEGRARNKGGKRYTTTEVKKKLGLD